MGDRKRRGRSQRPGRDQQEPEEGTRRSHDLLREGGGADGCQNKHVILELQLDVLMSGKHTVNIHKHV